MPKSKKSKSKLSASKNKTVRILSVIGAIISIIFGFLLIIGYGVWIGPFISIIPGWPIVEGVLVIIFGVIILTSFGVISLGPKVEHNWLILLIFSILSLIFGGSIGAILILIAAIIALVQRL